MGLFELGMAGLTGYSHLTRSLNTLSVINWKNDGAASSLIESCRNIFHLAIIYLAVNLVDSAHETTPQESVHEMQQPGTGLETGVVLSAGSSALLVFTN